MKISTEQIDEWMAGKKIGNSKFKLNEYVVIISGEHSGKTGSVISLEENSENPNYIIELESGYDVLVKQSEIESRDT